MDTTALLVGDSRQDDDSDYAGSHNLEGVPKQAFSDGLRLDLRGEALQTLPVNFQSYLIARMDGEYVGGIP